MNIGSTAAQIAEALDRIDNDLELYKELVSIYLKEFQVQREILKVSLENSDRSSFERTAHSVKGASANVGAVGAQAVAFELEKLGRGGELAGSKVLLAKLDQEIAAFEAEFIKFVQSAKA